jgi:hypothetical protein
MQSEVASMKASQAQFEFKPEPERLDLESPKAQLAVGFVLIFTACLVGYWQSLSVGFLLDDFLHVDYVSKALAGNWSPFLNNFTGNWAGSDIMKSYRPVASLTIFLDYLFWQTEGFGFHLTNVIVFFGCCAFVSLITLELSGRYGNRLGATPAIWAGLLFAVYPLHPEAVAWVIGRVDLLCGLFYLASVFCYLRFRLLRDTVYLKGSLLCFLLALLSKEMAVTLPVVITLAELLLPALERSRRPWQETVAERLKFVLSFWLLLGLYAAFRAVLLGTLVGGYGSSGAMDLLKSWRVFLDRPTLWKVIFPASEEVAAPDFLRPLLVGSCALTLALFCLRLLLRAARPGPLIFLMVWCVAALVPTFQIWHIYPNLVGSRLFFISSAPLCISLALCALPTVDALKRWHASVIAAAGTALLLVTFLGWSYLLELNLKPWVAAGSAMKQLRQQLTETVGSMPPGKKLLLLNLPTDVAGAGLLTRPQYLEIISRPPFTLSDSNDRLATIEPIISGSHDFMWPHKFMDMLNSRRLFDVLIWDISANRFKPWQPGSGEAEYHFSAAGDGLSALTYEPKNAFVSSKNEWNIIPVGSAIIEAHPDVLRFIPGTQKCTVFFPVPKLDPVKAQVATLALKFSKASDQQQICPGKVKLIWKAESQSGRTIGQPDYCQTEVFEGKPGDYRVWLGRFRKWTLAKSINAVGIEIAPGDVVVDLYGFKLEGFRQSVPLLNWDRSTGRPSSPNGPYGAFMFNAKRHNLPSIVYSAGSLPNAKRLKLFVTASGTTFDAQSEQDTAAVYPGAGPTVKGYELDLNGLSGKMPLPLESIKTPGLHQLRIVALDQEGKSVGFPSEPLTVESR